MPLNKETKPNLNILSKFYGILDKESQFVK